VYSEVLESWPFCSLWRTKGTVTPFTVFQLSKSVFAQGWAALAERGISLFQDVTVLWSDKPTDRGARGVHVDDAGVDVADFLSATGMEKHIGILLVRSNEDGIALDLRQRFRLL
jgi:hypothetical protein